MVDVPSGSSRTLRVAPLVAMLVPFLAAASVEVAPRVTRAGDRVVFVACDPGPLVVDETFVHGTYWDLVTLPRLARATYTVTAPRDAPRPHYLQPEPRWLSVRVDSEPLPGALGHATHDVLYLDPAHPSFERWSPVAWSESAADYREVARTLVDDTAPSTIAIGATFERRSLQRTFDGRTRTSLHSERVTAIGEGIVLTPAGPREALLLQAFEEDDAEPLHVAGPEDSRRVSYRFVVARQGEVARIVGPEGSLSPYFGMARTVTALAGSSDAAQGIQIHKSLMPLQPRNLFLAMYATSASMALSAIDPAWTTAGPTTSLTSLSGDTVTRVDPQTGTTLPETWDFVDALVDPASNGGVTYTPFNRYLIVQDRDEAAGARCGSSTFCSSYAPPVPTPANGTWQYYLKFDYWTNANPPAYVTRDIDYINDNDTNNPSLDITQISTDELATSDWQQICFAASPGILAKFLKFNYNGPSWDVEYDPVGSNDRWTNSGWTAFCGSLNIRDTATGCGSGGAAVLGKDGGCVSPGYGLDFEVFEDGYVRARTGNILPALLVRQATVLNVLLVCVSAQQQRNYDYWWFSEKYGILGHVSSTNDCARTDVNWDQTDGAYLTFGLFPPRQVTTQACVNRVRASWVRPLGCPGANCDTERYIDNYKVYWGPTPGSKAFNSGALPKTQTSYDITANLSSPTYVSVVSTYTYADPQLGNTYYESPLSYNVSATPLASGTFVVGNTLTEVKSGAANMALAWSAVAGASTYTVNRGTSPNPATHTPYATGLGSPAFTTSDGSGGDGNDYYYQAFAVDACGTSSSN